jgi:hypothetical protein
MIPPRDRLDVVSFDKKLRNHSISLSMNSQRQR